MRRMDDILLRSVQAFQTQQIQTGHNRSQGAFEIMNQHSNHGLPGQAILLKR